MKSKDQILNQIVQVIKADLEPSKVYLFGSRARGDHKEDSDYDVVIILDKLDQPRIEIEQRLLHLTFDISACIDFIVYTQSEFDEWKTEFGAIPYECVTEGIALDV